VTATQGVIVNDISGLNPIETWAVVRPQSIDEVRDAMVRSQGPISVGGGHFSMGGQTASPGSLHLDMRALSGVTRFEPISGIVQVLAGTRWCDLQRFLDPHGRAVKIMQTYANFTIGGALSVNCHGRYVGLGPVIMSVKSIRLVTADGALRHTSPSENSDLFYAAIGGYGAIGVIVEAELETVLNERVERVSTKMKTASYQTYFREHVRHAAAAVFHNADLYPPHYRSIRATTWSRTARAATHTASLQTPRRIRAFEQYMMWTVTEWPFGKARREYLVDPILFRGRKVHWRNYEAGYDVAELEPLSRTHRTYVLQEYFVPIRHFDEFTARMASILRRHRVNAVNVSVRHGLADPGSLLAWAREECFAFVLYYKQRTRANAISRVGVWTRELIDAAIACGGAYYLPYQIFATAEQFHAAYPRAKELFALKARFDPEFRFRNRLWDTYYQPAASSAPGTDNSEFKSVFGTLTGRDAFYRFLQTVFHLYPEDRLHQLIAQETKRGAHDEEIYRAVQAGIPTVKPALSELTYAVPALRTQKDEMLRQTLHLLDERKTIDGYLEIGSTGRYVGGLRRAIALRGPIYLLNGVAPTNSPVDILERGRLRKIGTFIGNADYRPIEPGEIPNASIELATCYVGLHHAHPDKVRSFVKSLYRCLKPGGLFILRDHDVPDAAMDKFVALVHTVFNAGTGVSWEENAAEPRFFNSIDHWVGLLEGAGLRDRGVRLLQENDPSQNTLMAFEKPPP
jgi:FAD/FMN-containing dehydrogenase/SAM-dependent methyltransferase